MQPGEHELAVVITEGLAVSGLFSGSAWWLQQELCCVVLVKLSYHHISELHEDV